MESSIRRKSFQIKNSPPFVGRRKEIAKIEKSLFGGETVIVSGKYGIGRTAIVRQIAMRNKEYRRFVFADCSQSAAHICQTLFAELFSNVGSAARDMGYKWLRDRIARFDGRSYETVIIFDNIARLSVQKLDLFRYWKRESGFQFIAITESFLTGEDLAKLIGCLGPASTVMLDRLPLLRVQEFFEKAAQANHLKLKAAEVAGLARASGGHPFSMTQLLRSEIARRGLVTDSIVAR